jgi:Tfp pilus assembly protein PilV
VPATSPRRPGSEHGFLLVEVLISALLVAMIVIATFTGLEAASRASADQRRHAAAAVLAAQSQEQLRSDPATTLDALEYSPHTYTKTADGTTYKITQEAKAVNANGTGTGCNASETKSESGANIQITSSVTWALLESAKRPAVKAVSIISPPTGSALEVDVTNGGTQPISGVTAKATFTPVESSSPTTVEGTTSSTGCVVLTGIAATVATVEIGEKVGFVTPNGLLKWPTKEVKIAPNITTHYPVTYAEGGRVSAKYTYKGATEWEGKAVASDTFVVFNSSMTEKPGFEVGSTAFEYGEAGGEERYKALTGTFSATAATAAGSRFPNGDLFPFETNKWQVYAGDCTVDSTEAVTAKGSEPLKNPAVLVEAGKTTVVEVPLSYLTLNLLTGTWANRSTATLESAGSYPVKITNSECSSAGTPNNALGSNLVHTQSTSAGHLGNPFQPFGKYEFCVAYTTKNRVFRTSFENLTTAGSTINLYAGEPSTTEREAEEKTAKEARIAKEASEKSARESAEAAERTQWKKEVTEGKRKSSELPTLESKQASERATKEAAETTKRKEAEKAEETAKTNRIKEEGERGYTETTGSSC